MDLDFIHYAYIIFLIISLFVMFCKKSIVPVCIVGIFSIGLIFTGNLFDSISILYNSVLMATSDLLGVILIISIVVSMSEALSQIGTMEYMLQPFKKIFISPIISFLILGIITLIFSWFMWPTPAIMLIGAILIPAALKSGLPKIWIASCISLFGYALGLSIDFIISGAPAITASSTSITTANIIKASFPLWISFAIGIIITSIILLIKDKNNFTKENIVIEKSSIKNKKVALLFAILTPILFIIDIFIIWKNNLIGGDATALIGGTSLSIIILSTILSNNRFNSFEKIEKYLKNGFKFGFKIFVPVIFISAFFFLGNGEFATKILGENSPNILSDIGLYLSTVVSLSKGIVISFVALIGGIAGFDGSGFSGLSLVGNISQTFGTITEFKVSSLAAFGQIVTITVGGGALIPWAVIPVAAICNVDPIKLVKHNLLPIIVGFICMFTTMLIIL
ncbi:MAG: hypothetical protein ACK5HL_01570 [Bacilli bacterium]